jgi:hypothetical protein
VDTNTDPHEHVLRSLNNCFSVLKQICALKSAEAEIVVVVVSVVDKTSLDLVYVALDHSVDLV